MTTKTFEIMLTDLCPSARARFFKFDGASQEQVERFSQTGVYENFDIYPIAVIEREQDE